MLFLSTPGGSYQTANSDAPEMVDEFKKRWDTKSKSWYYISSATGDSFWAVPEDEEVCAPIACDHRPQRHIPTPDSPLPLLRPPACSFWGSGGGFSTRRRNAYITGITLQAKQNGQIPASP